MHLLIPASSARSVLAALVASMAILLVGAAPAHASWAWMGTMGLPLADDQLERANDVERAADGTLYVTDPANGRIQHYQADGTIIRTIGSPGAGAGELGTPWGVAIGPDGSIYVADGGNHRITKYASDGSFVTSFGTQGSGVDELDEPRDVAVADDGTVYVADFMNSRVQYFAADGTHLGGFGSLGSADGELQYPEGITIAADGTVYVVDTGNNRIQQFTTGGTYVATYGSGCWGCTDDGEFNSPSDVDFADDGTMYVADTYNDRIQHLAADGSFIAKFGIGCWGCSADGETMLPRGVAVGSDGSVYVADYNPRVQRFGSDGTFLAKFGTAPGGNGYLSGPGSAVVSGSRAWVYDSGNRRVQGFSTTSYEYEATFGSEGFADGEFGGDGWVTAAPDGSVYVVDHANNRVQRFDSSGSHLASFGSWGTGAGQFRNPHGIAVATDGTVYVADTDNDRVQTFDGSGTYLGEFGTTGTADGEFNGPTDVAIAPDGTVLVVDTGNDRVQRFDASGSFLAAYGSTGSGPGQLSGPVGIAVNGDGELYVADAGNNRVEWLSDTGAAIGSLDSVDGSTPFGTITDVAAGAGGLVYVVDSQEHRVTAHVWDVVDPTGTISATPAGPARGTITITGTAADAASRVDHVDVTYSGPESGSICLDPASPTAWSCDWDTSALAHGTYTIELTVTDIAGNDAVITRTIEIDNAAPSASFSHFTEDSGAEYAHIDGTTLFFNPAEAGSFTVHIAASDDDSGMDGVDFPDLDDAGTLWSPDGGTDSSSSPYAMTYTWASGASEPGTHSATARDLAGNSATADFTVTADATAPTGGTISYDDVTTADTSTTVSFSAGTDAGSGVDTWQLQRSVAALDPSGCGAWGAWSNVGSAGDASPSTDSTLANASCYRYRLEVTDLVGNVSHVTTSNVVRVDTDDPAGTISASPAGPSRATITVTGTASDPTTDVDFVDVTYSGPETGAICLAPTSPTAWSCDWDTSSLAAGTYTVELTVTDIAGNDALVTRTIEIDNTAPSASFSHFTEDSGTEYTHIDGTTLYFNPAEAGSFTVHVTASDDDSGMDGVDFPDLDGSGALWSPDGGTDSSSSPYAMTYTWASGASEPGSRTATARDLAGNSAAAEFTVTADATAPSGGTITYAGGTTTASSTTVSYSAGSDAASGVATWQLQRSVGVLGTSGCGSWDAWSDVGSVDDPGPWTDSGLDNASCYRYRLAVTDSVGNTGYVTTSSVVRVDRNKPTVSVTPWGGGIFNASHRSVKVVASDAETPPTVTVTWRGRAVSLGAGGSIDLRKLRQGKGVLRITATDAAGHATVWQRRMVIDRGAPYVKRRTVHMMGPIASVRVHDAVSGPRRRYVKVRARNHGRNVVSALVTDRAGNRGPARAVVVRHLSLSDASLNRGLVLRGADRREFLPGQQRINDTFWFYSEHAPWYRSTSESPPLVREVQSRLKLLGYMPRVQPSTGVLDIPTIRSVQRFQRANGIPAIGTVGPLTRAALDRELLRSLGR